MTLTLNGHSVLVTRPRGLSYKLCSLIRESGGAPLQFPTLEIAEAAAPDRARIPEKLSWASHVIFVSRNAVIYLDRPAGDLDSRLAGRMLFAIGPGTAQELEKKGLKAVVPSQERSGSEALLKLDELGEKVIRERNVLIVRGDAGRELLKNTLEERGAMVEYVTVYRRLMPQNQAMSAESIWHDGGVDVIVVTSIQGLQNLVDMTAESMRPALFKKPLVVLSPRIRESARIAGFTVPAIVAAEQSDQGLLEAIKLQLERTDHEF